MNNDLSSKFVVVSFRGGVRGGSGIGKSALATNGADGSWESDLDKVLIRLFEDLKGLEATREITFAVLSIALIVVRPVFCVPVVLASSP